MVQAQLITLHFRKIFGGKNLVWYGFKIEIGIQSFFMLKLMVKEKEYNLGGFKIALTIELMMMCRCQKKLLISLGINSMRLLFLLILT